VVDPDVYFSASRYKVGPKALTKFLVLLSDMVLDDGIELNPALRTEDMLMLDDGKFNDTAMFDILIEPVDILIVFTDIKCPSYHSSTYFTSHSNARDNARTHIKTRTLKESTTTR